MGVWCCYTADCLAKPSVVFKEVSFDWSICVDVHTHFTNNFKDVTVTNTVCGLLWADILHVVLPSGKYVLFLPPKERIHRVKPVCRLWGPYNMPNI